MPNRIEITGNIGQSPVTKHVDTASGRRQVTQFSVFADDYRRDQNDQLEQVGGFWARAVSGNPRPNASPACSPRAHACT